MAPASAPARRLRVLEHHLARAQSGTDASSSGGESQLSKITSAEDAVRCIRDGSAITASPVDLGLPSGSCQAPLLCRASLQIPGRAAIAQAPVMTARSRSSHGRMRQLVCHKQVAGFVGTGLPEALVNAVRQRFDASAHPCDLHLYAVAAVGDGKGRGM